MILTDREIKISIEEGLIDINPSPAADAYSSTSVDLKLGNVISEFVRPTQGLKSSIDPAAAGYSFNTIIGQITHQVSVDEHYELAPNRLILAWTNERVNLKASACRSPGRG